MVSGPCSWALIEVNVPSCTYPVGLAGSKPCFKSKSISLIIIFKVALPNGVGLLVNLLDEP